MSLYDVDSWEYPYGLQVDDDFLQTISRELYGTDENWDSDFDGMLRDWWKKVDSSTECPFVIKRDGDALTGSLSMDYYLVCHSSCADKAADLFQAAFPKFPKVIFGIVYGTLIS